MSLLRTTLLSEKKAHPDRYSTTSDNLENGPCVCWVYFMGATCLCVPCYYKLLAAGVKDVPWEAGVEGAQTVKDGVRIAPDPDEKGSESGEIERIIGAPVSPEEVCWANLGSLSLFNKPLGDLIEDSGKSGKALSKSLFRQLVGRGLVTTISALNLRRPP